MVYIINWLDPDTDERGTIMDYIKENGLPLYFDTFNEAKYFIATQKDNCIYTIVKI